MSTPRRSTRPPESARDLAESAFTPILRSLWSSNAGVLAVAFVDLEGECVDYCSSIPPFDAKVAGAHLRIVVEELRARCAGRLGAGGLRSLHIAGDRMEILARRVTDEYLLVVLLRPARAVRKLLEEVEETVLRLRSEAGVPPPAWDVVASEIVVEVRAAKGWPYAPSAFTVESVRTEVAAVLGRWVEGTRATGGELVCFRVRTPSGEELTLAHDLVSDRWLRR